VAPAPAANQAAIVHAPGACRSLQKHRATALPAPAYCNCLSLHEPSFIQV
jgi:hypothetical protein